VLRGDAGRQQSAGSGHPDGDGRSRRGPVDLRRGARGLPAGASGTRAVRSVWRSIANSSFSSGDRSRPASERARRTSSASETSQSRTTPSSPPTASQRPSGLSATHRDGGPMRNVILSAPGESGFQDQSRAVPSWLVLASHRSAGPNARLRIFSSCPTRRWEWGSAPPDQRSQTRMSPRRSPVASHRPSWLNERKETGS
jgi:hypothetical protein